MDVPEFIAELEGHGDEEVLRLCEKWRQRRTRLEALLAAMAQNPNSTVKAADVFELVSISHDELVSYFSAILLHKEHQRAKEAAAPKSRRGKAASK